MRHLWCVNSECTYTVWIPPAEPPESDEEVDVDEPAPAPLLQPPPAADDGSGTDTDDDGELIRKVSSCKKLNCDRMTSGAASQEGQR
jgi:hypothetical protein